MNIHEFTLRFDLQDADKNTDDLLNDLYESGCGDALVQLSLKAKS